MGLVTWQVLDAPNVLGNRARVEPRRWQAIARPEWLISSPLPPDLIHFCLRGGRDAASRCVWPERNSVGSGEVRRVNPKEVLVAGRAGRASEFLQGLLVLRMGVGAGRRLHHALGIHWQWVDFHGNLRKLYREPLAGSALGRTRRGPQVVLKRAGSSATNRARVRILGAGNCVLREGTGSSGSTSVRKDALHCGTSCASRGALQLDGHGASRSESPRARAARASAGLGAGARIATPPP